MAEGAIVDLDSVTGRDRQRIPIGRERMLAATATEAVLGPRHPLLDETNAAFELSRLYRSVDLVTHQVRWERNLAKQAWEMANQAPYFVTNVVAGSLGEAWIGRWRESTFGASREDGGIVWMAKDIECGMRPDSLDGRVFGMSTSGGWFYVLDERTGALLSRYESADLAGAAYPRPAAFLGEYAVYGMESGHLAVFDPRNGQLVWLTRLNAPVSDVRVIEGLVYVATGKGELLVYEPTAPVPGLG